MLTFTLWSLNIKSDGDSIHNSCDVLLKTFRGGSKKKHPVHSPRTLRFFEGRDFAPYSPREISRPLGDVFEIVTISQYIPPLGSVQIQYWNQYIEWDYVYTVQWLRFLAAQLGTKTRLADSLSHCVARLLTYNFRCKKGKECWWLGGKGKHNFLAKRFGKWVTNYNRERGVFIPKTPSFCIWHNMWTVPNKFTWRVQICFFGADCKYKAGIYFDLSAALITSTDMQPGQVVD